MIRKIKENVFELSFKDFGSLVYVLKLSGKNILIDTSSSVNKEELTKDLKELGIKIDIVLITHHHYDHDENLDLFEGAKIYDFRNIDEFSFEGIKVIKTPGHTKDSLCFLYQDVLFSGDTIFHEGGRGRTDLEGGSEVEILESIRILDELEYSILCPGH